MNIHFIIHESFESPAAIEHWAIVNSHIITKTNIYQCQKLPTEVDDIDLLIIMGGPQSPNTSLEDCPYFNASEEILFIQKAINNGKTVLGVCLGAQLIGEALGASVERSPHKEIGVYSIYLTENAKSDHLVKSLPDRMEVAHWHGDMPGLTPNAKVLAYSATCPRQIISYSPRVYGFQCHFEFTSESVLSMIEHSQEELNKSVHMPYVCQTEWFKAYDFQQMNNYLFTFLDKLALDITSTM